MKIIIFVLVALVLGFWSVELVPPPSVLFPVTQVLVEQRVARQAADRLLDRQLGDLAGHVTLPQRQEARDLLIRILPLQLRRYQADSYEMSDEEWALLEELNEIYHGYTLAYLGDGSLWDDDSDEEPAGNALASFSIQDGQLTGEQGGRRQKNQPSRRDEYAGLWEQVVRVLPPQDLGAFIQFTVWSDGKDGTMAFVQQLDEAGAQWEIALDPEDAQDQQDLTETILHEYAHYLSLNDKQVVYTDDQTASTYNEVGMVSLPQSYLDQFYRQFWCNIESDWFVDSSGDFYLRHASEFISEYASTDPAEDLAESFCFFVLLDKPQGETLAQEKLRFFYDYPELVEMRDDIRKNLGLEDPMAG